MTEIPDALEDALFEWAAAYRVWLETKPSDLNAEDVAEVLRVATSELEALTLQHEYAVRDDV
jgi:hypothetical protein